MASSGSDDFGIPIPPGDPDAIRGQADALERAAKALHELSSRLGDPDRALVMPDEEWLALFTRVAVAERELAGLAGTGDVFGDAQVARAFEAMLLRMTGELATARHAVEELWSRAKRERPTA